MKCTGIDVRTGDAIEVSASAVIDGVDHLIAPPPGLPYISAGFIDLQVNGFAGVDYCSPDAPHDEIARSIRALYATGVTRFFPTVITGSPENMLGALRNLARAKEALPEGIAMEGFHVEGPHISPEDGPRGAHPQRWVRPPDLEEFRRWQDAANGLVRLVTISPEWPGAPAYIEAIVREGVVASIGHTKASAEQIRDAVRAGATLSTHLGNGAHAVLQRHPNYIWEQLADDRLNASFIADGIHLDRAFLRVAIRAKGVERSVLITDAVMPAGCSPGPYKLGEVDVELHSDRSVRLRGGTRLAGSALTMDYAIGKVIEFTGIGLREAIAMATTNPARVGRIASRQRGISVADRADLVRFEYDPTSCRLRVLETWVSGERVYAA
ncbi:MAG TPA: amidohydrolase family protein [Bryobacteraceae bacterium]|nr:amidohydrolase family protein [Bryobacteraceae bacterium]